MTGPKTNERDGTRAVLRYFHMSAPKARLVLDLIRGRDVNTAREILSGTTREAADVIGKLLASAVANAQTNDGQSADELYVSACFADEGPTMKRFTPRARGRSGRIRKRTTHITVIVSRMDEDRIEIVRAARSAQAAVSRTRRVASSRRRADQQANLNRREAAHEAEAEALAAEALEAEEAEALLDDETGDILSGEGTDASDADDVVTDVDEDDENDENDAASASDASENTAPADATEETDN
jgi:large subunit ribosomal protein L22